MNIRLLRPEDWLLWKGLRLEGLSQNPESFGSSFEEESGWSDEEFKDGLRKSDIFGAFVKDQLVGCVGFSIINLRKACHRGVLWGMYVSPQNRNAGIASELIKYLIMHAKTRVIQLELAVVTDNPRAIKFYQKYGFEIYGKESRSLKIGDKFYDVDLMVLRFD